MQKPIWNLRSVVLAVIVSLSASAQADDSSPPCWRGGSNTTYQSWVFTASNNPAVPEVLTNPNGPCSATFTIGAFGKGWLATSFGGKTGLWELGRAGSVSVAVPNFGAVATAAKYVQVQVTYFEDAFAYLPPTVTIAGATLVSSQTINNLSAPPGLWRTQTTLWQIFPSPASEAITIAGDLVKGLLIDQIIVDTRVAMGGDGDVVGFRPCWRGLADTTFQHWSFGMSNNPASLPAEIVTNAFGAPSAGLVLGPFSSGYIAEVSSFFGCRQGIWDLGRVGTMTLNVPNAPGLTPGSYKYVQVEVTQLRDGIYAQTAAVSLPGGTLVNQQEQVVETNGFGEVWFVHKTLWRMGPPSPAIESVIVTGGTNGSLIDQVVIDTLRINQPCPSDILASADPGQCSKSNVTWAVPAIDGCVVTNVVCVPAVGSTFPVGTNPVTCVTYDRHGGTRTCNFTVVITDNEAPTVVCPANIVVARDPAQCGAFVNFTPVGADNCSVASITSTPASGSLFPLGLTTVTSVAHDASSNNSAPCNFTVQVIDFTGDTATNVPCWRGAPASTFQQWAFGNSNNPAAISPELITNSFGASQVGIVLGAFSSGYLDQFPFLGCRQGIWDLGLSGTLTVNVPNTPAAPIGSYKYVQVAVTQYRDSIYAQNAAVSIAGGTLVSQQQQTIETTLFGATWTVEKTVWRLGPPCPASETIVMTGGTNGSLIDQVVVDTLCLSFPCPTNFLANADPGQCSKSNVTWSVPVVDGCVVTNVTCVPALGSTFPVGINPVTCVTYDHYGGTTTCNFTVTVNDTQLPIAACQNISVNLNGLGLATITGAAVDNGSTDNCGIASRTVSPSSFTCANVGPNNVTLTVTDMSGNVATCGAVVTVVDNQLPQFTCPTAITNVPAFGTCSTNIVLPDLTATDNCGVATVTSNAPASFPVGTTLVTWIVVDVNNNTNSCTQLVTIVDNQLPQFACPTALTNNADAGLCSATLALPALSATDNCGVTSVTSNAPASFPLGTTPVTWIVVDVNDNTNSCVQLVTILDNQLPQIVCPANILTNSTVDCSQVVLWSDPVVTDNCAVTNLTCVPGSGSTFAVGVTIVNCTVWDNSGNTNSCSFTVTVNASADLSLLTMTASPNPVTLGSNVIYSVTVSNAGPCTATGVIVSNFLSAGQVALLTTNSANVGMGCPFPGPVAWWPAEGNANDAVGGNHGTLAGGVNYLAGTVGQAFNFDGTNDSVTVPDAPALRHQSLTIEGWIKVQDVTGVHVIIGKRLGGATIDSYSMWIGSGVLFASISDTNGSGQFMTYPEFPTSSLFVSGDIVDLQSFAYALQPAIPADQVSQFIKTNLQPSTALLLAAYGGGPDPTLESRLINDLNAIISNGSIFETNRFGAVTLSAESQYILGRNPTGSDLVRLNRFLIRDAYPTYFVATVFPQLNQWFHVAYSFDDATKVQALYVNGNLVNASVVNKSIDYDTHPVLIGADDNGGSPGFFYQGEVDELSLYNRALTGSEIQAVYLANSAGKCPVAGTVSAGNIPSGATAQVTFVSASTGCLPLTANANVFSQITDPTSGNNDGSANTTVQELPSSEWVLNIERVSVNNNLLRIIWPMTCDVSFLESTTNLVTPIWSPVLLPPQMINSRNNTIVPANETMEYFRLNNP